MLGLGDGHAVAGDDDDFICGGEDGGGLFGSGAVDGLASAPPAAAAWTWPKAPKRTLVKERFIAST